MGPCPILARFLLLSRAGRWKHRSCCALAATQLLLAQKGQFDFKVMSLELIHDEEREMSIKYLNLTAIVFATLALLLTGCQRETGEIRSSMDPPCEVEAGQSAVFGAILNNSTVVFWSRAGESTSKHRHLLFGE